MRALTSRTMTSIERLSARPAGFWMMLALALLTKATIILILNDEPPNVDGILYLRAAQEMAQGNLGLSLSIYPMPAYSFLLWIAHGLTNDWVLAARALSVLALTGAAALLYLISYRLFDRSTAFWAMLAFLVTPVQNEMAALIYRGPVYLCLFAVAVWLMGRALNNPGVPQIVMAAFVGSAAVLFRIEGVFLTPLFLGVLLVQTWRRPARRRTLLTGLVLYLAMSLSVVVAAAMLIGQVDGTNGFSRLDEVWQRLTALISGEAWQSYHRIREGLEAIEASAEFPNQNWNFGEIARRYVWLIYLTGFIQLMIKVLHPAFVIPLAAGLRRPFPTGGDWLLTVFAVYALLLYAALVINDYSNERFVLAACFLLYPWVGHGVVRLLNWLKRYRYWRQVIVALLLTLPIEATLDRLSVADECSVAAGRWLAQSLYQDALVLGNDPRIPFAAGMPLYGPSDRYAHYRPENRDYTGIEAEAMAGQRPLIFLKLRKTRMERMPTFNHYQEIKRFDDGEKIVFVFADPNYPAPGRLPQ